ncbi:siphovirus Gp157 family protein [Sulfurimonas sp.]|jgi:hypothetical protein|uniref:siphovirus Gp157 family protein n=1 Tax=Sulfurimonas sp. TaxID=2022749 RepID=UPI002A35BCE1|nr:siphovirus Gp157 family protein [Sulfurimonas sp.]MDY0122918.1 siphovirus Gp157 family protein [Sulfurimonas sp.]
MKTTRYKFEQLVQEVKEDTKSWLRDEFKSILESEKDYTRKCDYIGFSIASIDDKVASLDEEIQELQELKKKLKSAKEIALTTGAELFAEYGIEKLEGAGISSITLTKESTKSKTTLEVLDEEALIKLGYFTLALDEEAVIEALSTQEELEILSQYARLHRVETTSTAKLRVNKRRVAVNSTLAAVTTSSLETKAS